MKLLFNDKPEQDVVIILSFIEGLASEYCPGNDISIDVQKIKSIAQGIRRDFPHNDGLEQASVFKKVANFITYFVAEKPILETFKNPSLSPEILKINNYENSIVALLIGLAALHNSKIYKNENSSDKEEVCLNNPIELSKHSFVDLVDALSNITPQTHFKLLTVLLEQLSYKTNPECQYCPQKFN